MSKSLMKTIILGFLLIGGSVITQSTYHDKEKQAAEQNKLHRGVLLEMRQRLEKLNNELETK